MKKILASYPTLALIFTNTVLLFVILNIIAWFMLRPADYAHYITNPKLMLENRPELMQQIYEGRSVADIKMIQELAPNLKSHPVLEFMTTPVTNTFYEVGAENCRMDSFITPVNFSNVMNGNTWIMGGSTAFGFRVAGNETISYYLNRTDSSTRYLNFGSPSYHQRLEIEKLIILLQKGYRPARVVFFDGLNDIVQLVSNPFDAAETPGKPFDAYVQDIGGSNMSINKNLLYALPVIRLWYHYRAKSAVKEEHTRELIRESLYHEKAMYNKHPFLHYKLTELYEPDADSALLLKTDRYYLGNFALIEALSKAWHFEYTVFYQPIGPLYENNPFIADKETFKQEFMRYKGFDAIHRHIRNRVKDGHYPGMVDLSASDALCTQPYVDLTHYSPSLNRLLAQQMLNHISAKH